MNLGCAECAGEEVFSSGALPDLNSKDLGFDLNCTPMEFSVREALEANPRGKIAEKETSPGRPPVSASPFSRDR